MERELAVPAVKSLGHREQDTQAWDLPSFRQSDLVFGFVPFRRPNCKSSPHSHSPRRRLCSKDRDSPLQRLCELPSRSMALPGSAEGRHNQMYFRHTAGLNLFLHSREDGKNTKLKPLKGRGTVSMPGQVNPELVRQVLAAPGSTMTALEAPLPRARSHPRSTAGAATLTQHLLPTLPAAAPGVGLPRAEGASEQMSGWSQSPWRVPPLGETSRNSRRPSELARGSDAIPLLPPPAQPVDTQGEVKTLAFPCMRAPTAWSVSVSSLLLCCHHWNYLQSPVFYLLD